MKWVITPFLWRRRRKKWAKPSCCVHAKRTNHSGNMLWFVYCKPIWMHKQRQLYSNLCISWFIVSRCWDERTIHWYRKANEYENGWRDAFTRFELFRILNYAISRPAHRLFRFFSFGIISFFFFQKIVQKKRKAFGFCSRKKKNKPIESLCMWFRA